MQEFDYGYIKTECGSKSRLLITDTDFEFDISNYSAKSKEY